MKLKILSMGVIILLLLTAFPSGSGFNNNYRTSDYWEYRAEESREGFFLQGTIRADFEGKEELTVGESTYSTVVILWAGEGNFSGSSSGMNVTGTWSIYGKQWFQESNEELIKTIEDYRLTGTYSIFTMTGNWSSTIRNESVYRVLEDERHTKIDVGDLGHSRTNVTSHQSLHIEMDVIENDFFNNATFILTKTYKGIKRETVVTPAGEFEAWQIKVSKSDGSYILDWRSPEVGFSLKQEVYNKEGEKTASMELTEYQYTEPESQNDLFGIDPSILYLLALVLIVIVASIVLIAIKRKK